MIRDPGFSQAPGMLSPQHIAALQGLLAQFAPQTKPRPAGAGYRPLPYPGQIHPALAPRPNPGMHAFGAAQQAYGQSPFGFLNDMFARKPGTGNTPALLPKRNMPAYGQPYNPYGGSNGPGNVPMPY